MITVTHQFDCGEGMVADCKLSDGDEESLKAGTVGALIESGTGMRDYFKSLGAKTVTHKIIIDLDAVKEADEADVESDSDGLEVNS